MHHRVAFARDGGRDRPAVTRDEREQKILDDIKTAADRLVMMTVDEIMNQPEPVIDRWGHWKYESATQVLSLVHGFRRYEVDLDDMTDARSVLDWIVQVSHKVWVTREDVGDLVAAIDHLKRLQQNVCGMGIVAGRLAARAARAHKGTDPL